MNNKTKLMNDYVDSLECNQLSEGQEALLLVGQSNELFGEGNGECENRSSCSLTINDRKCANAKCNGSINSKTCTSIGEEQSSKE